MSETLHGVLLPVRWLVPPYQDAPYGEASRRLACRRRRPPREPLVLGAGVCARRRPDPLRL